MPFTVITLKKVPNALRGDLTRWMQEISTGVYVGNINSKVREYLWKRVKNLVGQGEASMCFSCRNEIGYSFCTCNAQRVVVDYDGIPLVMIPAKGNQMSEEGEKTSGFSNASKYHRARMANAKRGRENSQQEEGKNEDTQLEANGTNRGRIIVFLDIETTGLHAEQDRIIEIGALKVSGEQATEFHRMIQIDAAVPDVVRNMTGITDEMLKAGVTLERAVRELAEFLHGTTLIGYNIMFDLKFIKQAFEMYSLEPVRHPILDMMREVRQRNMFQNNYKFETTLMEYGINQKVSHRALEDAKLMYQLYQAMGLGKQTGDNDHEAK